MENLCPLRLRCENCVQSEIEKFNKQFPKFPNGNADVVINNRNNPNHYIALAQFNRLSLLIANCENRINRWKKNVDNTKLDQEAKNYIAAIAIYLLKKKPLLPLQYEEFVNVEKFRTLKMNEVNKVAKYFKIPPKKLLKLISI